MSVAKSSLTSEPIGFVEGITREGARGWAWSPTVPDTPVEVEVVLQGEVIGRVIADRLRQDLLDRSYGNGRHGFQVIFNRTITGDAVPTLRIVRPDGYTYLPGAYKFPAEGVFAQSLAPEACDTTGASNPAGYVESITRTEASGWAWLPSAPDVFVQIEAVLNNAVIGRAIADKFRKDLADSKIGNGRHAFELRFMTPIIGDEPPRLRIVTDMGLTPLEGVYRLLPSPRTESQLASSVSQNLTPAAPHLYTSVGYVESLTRQGARGWAWAPDSPEVSVLIEANLDGKVIGRVLADGRRPDLEQRGIGTGRYGFAMAFDLAITGNSAPQFRVLVPLHKPLPGVTALPKLTQQDLQHRSQSNMQHWAKEHAAFTTKGPDFEEFDPSILDNAEPVVASPQPLLIAFYLPQYHAVPVNDMNWGKGFTEWRQLARGVSRFPGHYQPRTPRDLGFYDLNNLSAMRAQAEMAKASGVQAFAIYYYWFNGKRVLENPLNMLLRSDLDMPFLLLWANENWTRAWDGSDSDVLLRQDYRSEDEEALLKDFARHFFDDRYVRIGGRPLFIIYNPESIPDTKNTIARWRSILSSQYGLEPLIFMAQTFSARDPDKYGCDGAIEFPPHKTAERLVGRLIPDAYAPECGTQVIRYEDFVEVSLSEAETNFPLIKTAVPSWDNESRRPNRGLTLEGLSPAKYQAWLHELIIRALRKPIHGLPIVAINAWNEWAEAAYLEPDVYYGASYLNATAKAYVSATQAFQAERDLANARRP